MLVQGFRIKVLGLCINKKINISALIIKETDKLPDLRTISMCYAKISLFHHLLKKGLDTTR